MSEVSGSAEAGTGGAAQRPAGPHLAHGYESGRRLYECESSLLTRSLQEVQSSDSGSEFWQVRETASCTHSDLPSPASDEGVQAVAATGAAGVATRPPLETRNCMDTADSAGHGQQSNSAFVSPDDPGEAENKGRYPWKVACGMACASGLVSCCQVCY